MHRVPFQSISIRLFTSEDGSSIRGSSSDQHSLLISKGCVSGFRSSPGTWLIDCTRVWPYGTRCQWLVDATSVLWEDGRTGGAIAEKEAALIKCEVAMDKPWPAPSSPPAHLPSSQRPCLVPGASYTKTSGARSTGFLETGFFVGDATLGGELPCRARCQWWFGPRVVLLATHLVFVFGKNSEVMVETEIGGDREEEVR